MKKITLSIFALTLFSAVFAQEPADALRLSYPTTNGGTARNQALGGAGVSLGGEFSTLFINPAGLAFNKSGDVVLSPAFSFKNNKGTYLGSENEAQNRNFNMGASGIIFAAPSGGNTINNITIGIGINKIADFNNQIYYKGLNKASSYSEKYLEELYNAQATDPNEAAKNFPYGSSLAINTYLVSPIYDAQDQVTGYYTLANPSTGLTQENLINTTGGITDISLGLGANMEDRFYFGGSLSFPVINYERNATFTESDASGDTKNDFDYFESSEFLSTKGIGISGKLGLIYKPMETVRLGLAVHTPTYYQLTDQYVTSMVTSLEGFGGAGIKRQSSTDLDATNGLPLESNYNISTPWKVMAGATVMFAGEDISQQKGFLTADVEYVNYGGLAYHYNGNNNGDRDYYQQLNQSIKNLYKDAFNVKVGAELKFNTLMVRAGGAYYGNPYKNEESDIMKLSGGLGYRNKGMFVDLSYIHSISKDIHYPYLLQDKTNVPAFLKNTGGNVLLTLGFKI